MPRKSNKEAELIKRINDVNEQMKEINQEPIKKVTKSKTTSNTNSSKKSSSNARTKTDVKKSEPAKRGRPKNSQSKPKTANTTKKLEQVDTKETKKVSKEVVEKAKTQSSKKAVSKATSKKVKTEKELKEPNITKPELKNEEIKNDSENVIKENKSYGFFEIILTLIVIAFLGMLVGYSIRDKKEELGGDDYVVVSKEVQVFIDQYKYILDNYYGEIDKEELITSAISGMLETLDDYSVMIDENESNSTMIRLEGKYVGVGIEIYNDASGRTIVSSVFPGSSADTAGIKAGDIITKINGEDLFGKPTTDFVNIVADCGNKKIKLEVERADKKFNVEVSRKEIVLDSVYSKIVDDNIGYIDIDIFANNTDEQFEKVLKELEDKNIKGLIIDVRDNTGGHLSTVQNMLYQFLDSTHIIYQTESNKEKTAVYSKGKETKDYPIAILINNNSASASEILAATLSEEYGAYLIGAATFGKGTVQELKTIDGLGQYKFTTKKWLTPTGNWINEVGVQPNLKLNLSEDYFKNPIEKNDNQLQAAIKYIKGFKE